MQSSNTTTPMGHALHAALVVSARALLLDRQLEFWMRELGSLASLRETRARVEEVIEETADTRTFVLRPNRRWPGHRAGQWASVEVEIEGVRAQRCYSVSSAPGDPRPTITVKRVAGGRVSGYLHERIGPGDVLVLGDPSGDLVLPDRVPPRLLFVSGGSGITPLMSMLRALSSEAAPPDVVFVHYARSRRDVIFGAELEARAATSPWLRLHLRVDDESDHGPGLDEASLARLVPDLAERETFVCGPPGLVDRAESMWRARGLEARLQTERFVASPEPAREPGAAVSLRLSRSGRTLAGETETTLLAQLERAGERPRSGCRQGVCRSCTVTKRTGVTVNRATGVTSSARDEPIQLCVSIPCSDLDLAL